MRSHSSLRWAVVSVGVALLLVVASYGIAKRRARTLAEVAAEEVLKSLRWRPTVAYVGGQDPDYVVSLLKRGSIAGVRIEPTTARADLQAPFNSPSGAEMKLIITAIEPQNANESDVVVSYYFGPTNGQIVRLIATRSVFGWKIIHTEIEKVR